MVGSWARAVGGLILVLAGSGTAQAATQLQLLLNSDGNPATGCAITTVQGSVSGIEQILDTTIQTDASGERVGPVALRGCTGNSFSAATVIDAGGWPVGHLNDAAHTAVVETYLPRSLAGNLSAVQVGAIASSGNASDALLPVPVPGLLPPTDIPTLSNAMALLLTGLLAATALWGMRRSGGVWHGVGVLVLAGSLVGLVWAAVLHDGQVEDWAGVAPFWVNPTDDPAAPLSLRALYAQLDPQNVNFRIDVRLPVVNQPPHINAIADQTITLPATARLSGAVTDDGLPNPPGAVTVAWSLVSGPGAVTFDAPNAKTTAAAFSAAGVYVLRLTANDSQLSAAADVTLTVVTPVSHRMPQIDAEADPTNIPTACSAEVATGLCLLGSPELPEGNRFIVRERINGSQGQEQPVTLNVAKALTPGNYLLYRDTGLDQGHELRFTVQDGQVTTIRTATLRFDLLTGGLLKLQHFQARMKAEGEGCGAEIGNQSMGAYLPGNYQVKIISSVFNTSNADPKCEANGVVSFNLMSGQTRRVRSGAVADQTLAAGNRYRHSSSAYSLTNINSLRHDVSQVGFLSRFTAFRGIYNPSASAVDALVLSGAPHFDFVIPVQMNPSAACGLSLAAGGLPPRHLMTECVFDSDGHLTRFRVNAGAYYGYHNIHGKSAVASHTINSPFIVSGVKFNVKGN